MIEIKAGTAVLIRTISAGVFCGKLKEMDGETVELVDARRLWYWSGAASLSELSEFGVKKPLECKFPILVPRVILRGVIEILFPTPIAFASIHSVPVWSATK